MVVLRQEQSEREAGGAGENSSPAPPARLALARSRPRVAPSRSLTRGFPRPRRGRSVARATTVAGWSGGRTPLTEAVPDSAPTKSFGSVLRMPSQPRVRVPSQGIFASAQQFYAIGQAAVWFREARMMRNVMEPRSRRRKPTAPTMSQVVPVAAASPSRPGLGCQWGQMHGPPRRCNDVLPAYLHRPRPMACQPCGPLADREDDALYTT